ncbi:MAG: protoheme IX farnesyltransferase [Betaproteobacteria bacterium TMED41]|mgnify:CR=1 FL=1|nr:MAG: protoheme IX farnesyltransferase [Betaproteobacteria bacterium TMED41]|tara:strand:+ start:2612 stop:3502 length:891 start_codon:yes stop_codon:yes gene_type:complete
MTTVADISSSFSQYLALTKPKVNLLIVFCAVIGMVMALPQSISYFVLINAIIGITLVASAAAAVNCLVERNIDAKMARTAWRPLPTGTLTTKQTILFSTVLGVSGFALLMGYVNSLTAWLTLLTFAGYAFFYTLLLKPRTPQNIVIGGASGAMPPVLGWAAVTGTTPPEAWILFLIIFIWTPPHFWSLALYRSDDYERSGLPMLPVTHGSKFTRLQILLYTFLLIGTSVLPTAIGMSGVVYLAIAMFSGIYFLKLSLSLYSDYSEELARKHFKYSINYLTYIFAALMVDKGLQHLY